MTKPPMLYRELSANTAHPEVVACFWEFAASEDLAPGHMHSIPVDGSVSLGYIRPRNSPARAVFVGPRMQALQVPVSPGDRIFGIRFLPGASRAAVGKSGAHWRDKIGLLDFELPSLAAEIRSGLEKKTSLEEAVQVWDDLLHPSEPDKTISDGVLSITRSRGDLKLTELPWQIGMSERQFQRLFREEVGLTPKQFARICRFRAAAIDALHKEGIRWAEIAADGGFADQAHLTHEFQMLFGISPREFERRFLSQIEHGLLHTP